MFLSAFEIAGRDLRRAAEKRAGQALTPQHEASAAAVAAAQAGGDRQAGDRQAGDTPAEASCDAQAPVPQPREPGQQDGHDLNPASHVNHGGLLVEMPESLTARMGQVTSDVGKAFRDAAPGPGAFPAPSAMSPDRARPWPGQLPGQAATSPGDQPPGPYPPVPRTTLNAVDFRRGPLMGGQAAPSPSYVEGQ